MPMPARQPGLDPQCRRVNNVMALAGERWTLTVIAALGEGPRRFNELRRVIGGISQQMLTRTLKSLERDGLVSRTVFPSVPPQVEYALTPLGLTLGQAVLHLERWAGSHLDEIERNRADYDVRTAERPGVRPGAANAA